MEPDLQEGREDARDRADWCDIMYGKGRGQCDISEVGYAGSKIIRLSTHQRGKGIMGCNISFDFSLLWRQTPPVGGRMSHVKIKKKK